MISVFKCTKKLSRLTSLSSSNLSNWFFETKVCVKRNCSFLVMAHTSFIRHFRKIIAKLSIQTMVKNIPLINPILSQSLNYVPNKRKKRLLRALSYVSGSHLCKCDYILKKYVYIYDSFILIVTSPFDSYIAFD